MPARSPRTTTRQVWTRGARFRRSAVLASLLVMVTAVAASAHPSFNPNQLPAGEAVDAVLVIPHGCDPEGGTPGDGGASPTLQFDLQLPPEVTEFEPRAPEGWEVERVEEDGEEIVRWAATDGGTADVIEFPVTLTVDGPVDEPFYLLAFQECEEGSFRWIGTPHREAEYPAVRLTTTAGAIGTSEPEDSHGDEGHDDGHDDGSGHETEPGDDVQAAAPDDAATDPLPTSTDAPPAGSPTETGGDAAVAESRSGVSPVTVVVVLLVLAVGGGILWSRNRRGASG